MLFFKKQTTFLHYFIINKSSRDFLCPIEKKFVYLWVLYIKDNNKV